MSRQVSRQHRVVQLQPQHEGFFPCKSQKSRLEILGSLVFWLGLTLTKPAWTQAQEGEQPFTPGLSPLELSPSVRVTPSCSLTQELRLTPEQKLPCNSTPSLVADAKNAPNFGVEVQPSASENSSESQRPGSSEDPELGKLRLLELGENAPNFKVEV